MTLLSEGKALADRAAKKADSQEVLGMALIPQPLEIPGSPDYTIPKIEWDQQQSYSNDSNGWYTLDQRIMLPMGSQ